MSQTQSPPADPATAITMSGARRFLCLVVLGVLCVMGSIAVFNGVADPLAWRAHHRFADPDATLHGHEVIMNMLHTSQPDIVALGTSRTGAAWGSDAPAFRGRHFFNGSLPGATFREIADSADYTAKQNSHPREIIVGTYFLHDLVYDDSAPQVDRIHWNLIHDGNSWRDLYNSAGYLFSLDALKSSSRSLARKYIFHMPLQIRADGQELPYNFTHAVDLKGGPFAATRHITLPASTVDLPGFTNQLDRLLAIACKSDMKVTLVIEPMHASYMEWINQTGRWHDFEAWQRTIASRVQEGRCPVKVWSFIDVDAVSTEPLPTQAAPKQPMHYWLDLMHFSPEVGGWMLARMYGDPVKAPKNFGTRVDARTFEPYAQRLRSQYLAFAENDQANGSPVASVIRNNLAAASHAK